jgi:hypothetical protein
LSVKGLNGEPISLCSALLTTSKPIPTFLSTSWISGNSISTPIEPVRVPGAARIESAAQAT